MIKVFKIMLLVGGFFGVGNYGMCGCVYSLCFLWIWFNLWIVVMGGVQVVGVLVMVKCDVIECKGGIWFVEEEVVFKQFMIDMFNEQSYLFYVVVWFWDDGIIDLRQSCDVFVLSLRVVLNVLIEEIKFGLF